MGAFEQAVDRGVVEEGQITKEILEGFLGGYGRRFYGVEQSMERIVLKKGTEVVKDSFKGVGIEVVPFRRGQNTWSVEWK